MLLKTLFFLIKIPCYIERFKVITTTLGIANPKAQGQETTKIEIALSKGKHQTQNSSISTMPK